MAEQSTNISPISSSSCPAFSCPAADHDASSSPIPSACITLPNGCPMPVHLAPLPAAVVCIAAFAFAAYRSLRLFVRHDVADHAVVAEPPTFPTHQPPTLSLHNALLAALTSYALRPLRKPPTPIVGSTLTKAFDNHMCCIALVGWPLGDFMHDLLQGLPPIAKSSGNQSARISVLPLTGSFLVCLLRTEITIPPRVQLSTAEVEDVNLASFLVHPKSASQLRGRIPARPLSGPCVAWILVLRSDLHVPDIVKVPPASDALCQVVLLRESSWTLDLANFPNHCRHIFLACVACGIWIQPHDASVHAPPRLLISLDELPVH
mmetsp:Transcript_74602/g.142034  ORF Transcript_74602/g.142034 Transcript_74602/m.142034 type:complete len:320 (+) Transcript_74602:192-1151(+)